MTEFAAVNVKGSRTEFARLGFHFVCRSEKKFCLRVNEVLDQPRAGDAVHFDMFTRNPFHRRKAVNFAVSSWHCGERQPSNASNTCCRMCFSLTVLSP